MIKAISVRFVHRLWKNVLAAAILSTAVFALHVNNPPPTDPHMHDHVVAQHWAN